MATFAVTPPFKAQFDRLTSGEQTQFRAAVKLMVEALNGDGRFPRRLRVRKFNRSAVEWEMTWAPNGRALFRRDLPSPLGDEHQHIVWTAIGGHELFDNRRAAAR